MPGADDSGRIRVLVTAEDFGAAAQLAAVLSDWEGSSKHVDVQALASDVSLRAFIEAGIECSTVPPADIPERISVFDPDAVLLGLSLERPSLDDTAAHVARKMAIPQYAVQDYWGYLGQYNEQFLPDAFFVLDAEASRLTSERTSGRAKTVVAGSPRHERQVTAGPFHPGVNFECERPTVAIYGQPSTIPGVRDSLAAVIRSLGRHPGPLSLAFQPHPADDASVDWSAELDATGHPWLMPGNPEQRAHVLATAHLVVTPFSTIGFDHAWLQATAHAPLGNLRYVLLNEEVRAFFRQQAGTTEIPGTNTGMGTTITDPEELDHTLHGAIRDESNARGYHLAARRGLRRR
ncbi:MAG: hypothetical protein ACPGOU_03250, partial [Candidatus Nanopelagicales bacterium]